jgi:hypothetical protein
MLQMVAMDCIVDGILVANGLRSHVVRENAISSAKTHAGRYGFDLCEEAAHGIVEGAEFGVC